MNTSTIEGDAANGCVRILYSSANFLHAEDPNSINNPRSLSTSDLQTALDYALVRAGLRTTTHSEVNSNKNAGRVRKDVARFHCFREYCVTNMKNASLDFSGLEY
jgi:hypothetical protein